MWESRILRILEDHNYAGVFHDLGMLHNLKMLLVRFVSDANPLLFLFLDGFIQDAIGSWRLSVLRRLSLIRRFSWAKLP